MHSVRVFEFIFTAYFILFLCGAPLAGGPGQIAPFAPPLLAALNMGGFLSTI